jgi:anti-sigma regulatory factor (Ser/Thr protein kinase)
MPDRLPLQARFAADPGPLRAVRRRVRAALSADLASASDVESALLVFDELASNAIEHGQVYRRGGEPLAVRFAIDGDDLTLEFEDHDVPSTEVKALRAVFAAGVPELPDFEDERGRGLYIIVTTLESIQVQAIGDLGMRLLGRLSGVARR